MLDPERVKLSAANIGFLKQKGINVDFDTIRKALQTDDGGCAKVRREADTPVNELHVMGGQRLGLEGNMNINEYARQARQINGYPLRSFSASQPAVVLPPKYGGFPQYVNNESERDSYVSRFTEPLSAPLQQNTMLLGPQGFSVASNSASNPFEPLKFEMNLHKSRDAIDYNDMMLRQKKNLLQASMAGRANKGNNAAPMVAENNGIFISANGQIMSQVESATSAVYMQKTAFDKQQERARSYQQFQPPASDNGRYLNLNNTGRFYRTSEQAIQTDVLEDNASTIMPRSIYTANQEIVQSDSYTPVVDGRLTNGLQTGDLITRWGLNASESERYIQNLDEEMRRVMNTEAPTPKPSSTKKKKTTPGNAKRGNFTRVTPTNVIEGKRGSVYRHTEPGITQSDLYKSSVKANKKNVRQILSQGIMDLIDYNPKYAKTPPIKERLRKRKSKK